jgi:hypothetical protein
MGLRTFLELARTDHQRPWALRVGGGLPGLVILGITLHAVLLPALRDLL